MSGYITDTLGWLAGAFYVIVALSIVYLYFFRIAPMVIASIKEWNIFVVLRVTIVLASLAFLIGCVAVVTGDWIFGQVLDTLPRTRMAREIDRVSGSLVRLSVPEGYGAPANYNAGAGLSAAPGAIPAGAGAASAPPEAEPVSFPLKPNAIDIWVAALQQTYNPTGKLSDNIMVMTRRDLPLGVTCDAASIARGWFPKQYEEWQLVCSMDGFRTSTRPLRLNGTAVRGLTGGSYYSLENPYTVYGEGLWPEQAYDMSAPSVQPTPGATPGAAPQGGPIDPASSVATSSQTHTVQQGESLALIADRYAVKVDTLVSLNEQKYPRLKTNPNVIVVGWVLDIPGN